MTIQLTQVKATKIIEFCKELLKQSYITILLFLQLIGKLVASESGVEYAPLYYKPLEKEKEFNLKLKRGKYNAFTKLNDNIKLAIHWWVDNLESAYKKVSHGNPLLMIHCDASL